MLTGIKEPKARRGARERQLSTRIQIPSAGDPRGLGGLQRTVVTVTCNPHAVGGRKVRQFQGRKDGDLAHSQWHPTADHLRGLPNLQCGANYTVPQPPTVDDIVTSTTDPPPPAEQPAALLSSLDAQDLSDVTCSGGLESLACRPHLTLTSGSPPQTRRPADLCRNPLLKLIGAGVPVSEVPVAHHPRPSVVGLAASTPRTPQSAATRIKRSHLTSPASTLQRPTASLPPCGAVLQTGTAPAAPLGRWTPPTAAAVAAARDERNDNGKNEANQPSG